MSNILIEEPIDIDVNMESSYPTDDHGCLKIDGEYTGPLPRSAEDTTSKNNSFTTDKHGCFIDDAIYTGPSPILERNPSAKNNSRYKVREDGTLKDESGTYTGILLNESKKSQDDLQEYTAKEHQLDKSYEALKKYQKGTLRHAGYKIAPKNTVFSNSWKLKKVP